jgi:serine O-acetyltransferase
MNTNISKENLSKYTNKQLELHFPDGSQSKNIVYDQLDEVLGRIEFCFSRINEKYYNKDNTPQFDYLNTDHYASFLYFLSNSLWKNGGNESVAKKVYYLNKIMHCLDVFYEVELPKVFQFAHPVGTVLGRAKYSNYLVFSQGVTIGGSIDCKYPTIGKGVYFFPGSAVTGTSNIGDNSLVSIGTIIRDSITPRDSLLFNQDKIVSYKSFSWTVVDKFFK